MRVASKLALLGIGLALSGCATTNANSDDVALERMLSGEPVLQGGDLKAALKEADKHPLGSAQNPVRVNMPAGERAYLARLRCSDGRRPDFVRVGNVGIGAFGNIVDLYDVNCYSAKPGRVEIYMDMYFSDHVENRPVPGFTIAK